MSININSLNFNNVFYSNGKVGNFFNEGKTVIRFAIVLENGVLDGELTVNKKVKSVDEAEEEILKIINV